MQVVISAFNLVDRDGMWAWVVRRTDGKFAVAAHTDIGVDDPASDAVVPGTPWHKSLAGVRRELGMKRNPPSGWIPATAVKITRKAGRMVVRIRRAVRRKAANPRRKAANPRRKARTAKRRR